MDRPSPRGGYSTREVATLLGLSQAQIRSCARAGFVAPRLGPRGELLFSFQDLVLLRTAKALLAARIPQRRIRIALQNLHAQLPQGEPLTAVRIAAQGHHVVARDGGEAGHPEAGQTLLDFDVADLAREAAALDPRRGLQAPLPAPVPATGGGTRDERSRRPTSMPGPSPFPTAAARGARPSGTPPTATAADCYELAVALEADDPAAAEAAYRQALARDPDLADAHLNLGRLLHDGGDPAGAQIHYRHAVAHARRSRRAPYHPAAPPPA